MDRVKIFCFVMLGVMMMLSLTSFIGQPRRMKAPEFTNWVLSPSSGLQDKVIIDSYDYILSYLPGEFVALQQLRGRQISKKLFLEKFRELDGVEYYALILNLNNGKKNFIESLSVKTRWPSDQIVKFLAYDLQQSVQLVQGQDTLKCKFLHMEEMYESSSYIKLMMMFENETKVKGNRQLLVAFPWVEDQLKLTISEESLKNIPKVIIK